MNERQEITTITAALDVTPTTTLYSFLVGCGCELQWIEGHIYTIVCPKGTYKGGGQYGP